MMRCSATIPYYTILNEDEDDTDDDTTADATAAAAAHVLSRSYGCIDVCMRIHFYIKFRQYGIHMHISLHAVSYRKFTHIHVKLYTVSQHTVD